MARRENIIISYIMGLKDADFVKKQKAMEARFRKIGREIDNMSLKAQVGFAALAAGVGKAVGSFATYENKLVRAALTMNATREEQALMDKAIRDTAKTSQKNADEVADGMLFLAQAGLSVESSIRAIGASTNFAVAAGLDMGTATDQITDAMAAFIRKGAGPNEVLQFMERIGDVWLVAEQQANTTAEQIGNAFRGTSGAAKAFGSDVEETTAILLSMSHVAKGELAGTLAKNLFSSIQKNKEAIEEMGISVVDAEGNWLSIGEVIAGFQSKINAANTDVEKHQILMTLGEDRARRAMQAILQTGAEGYEEYLKTVRDAGGKTLEFNQRISETTQGQMLTVSSAIGDLLLAVGKAFEDTTKSTSEALAAIFLRISAWVQQSEGLTRSIIGWAAAILGAIASIRVITGAARILWFVMSPGVALLKFLIVQTGLLTAAKTALAWATAGATTAMKLFRFALIATGVGAVVVALGLMAAHFETIWGWIQRIFNKVNDFLPSWLKFWGASEDEEGDKMASTEEAVDEQTGQTPEETVETAQEVADAAGDADSLADIDVSDAPPEVQAEHAIQTAITGIHQAGVNQRTGLEEETAEERAKRKEKERKKELKDFKEQDRNLFSLQKNSYDDFLGIERGNKLNRLKMLKGFMSAEGKMKLQDAYTALKSAPPKAYRDTVAFLSGAVPPPGPQIAGAAAFALTLAQGVKAVQGLRSGQNIQIPGLSFRQGGIVGLDKLRGMSQVSGAGIGDSVPAMLEAGEMIVPRHSFSDVVDAIREQGESGDKTMTINVNLDGEVVSRSVIDVMAREGIVRDGS